MARASDSVNNPKGRILVVDDNEMNRDLLSRQLERRGYEVSVAHDGRQALSQANAAFDVVLLDIMMPDISGIEVLQELRKQYSSADLPIIMVSANDQSEDVVESMELGADDYVTKPFDFAVLAARVKVQLSRKLAEKALHRSQARYEQIVEGTSDIVYTTDAEGRFNFFNQQMEKATGYRQNEVLGKRFTHVVAPSHRKQATQFYLKQRKDGVKETVHEWPILVPGSKLRWMEQKVTLILDEMDNTVGFQAIVRDTTERRHLEEKNNQLRKELQKAVIHDSLTGLYNRRYLDERLEQELEAAITEGYALTILIFDLDGFKNINDVLGHPKGDDVLKEVANLLKRNLRKADLAFRYGGDEFVAVLPESNGKARQTADRILDAFQVWLNEYDLDDKPLGLSIGHVTWEPDMDPDPDQLLKAADEQLHKDKSKNASDQLRRQLTNQLQEQTEQVHLQTTFLNSIGEMIVATNLEGAIFYANETFVKLSGQNLDELNGMALAEAMPTFSVLLSKISNKDLSQTRVLKSPNKDDALLVNPTMLKTGRGRHYGYVYVGSDISALETTHQQLAQTHKLMRDLNAETELEPILQLILDQAVKLIPNAQSGSVQVLDKESNTLKFVAAVGWPLEDLQRIEIPKVLGANRLASHGKPIVLEEGFDRLDQEHLTPDLIDKFSKLGKPVASTLSASIRLHDEVIGKIHLDNHDKPKAFGQEDVALISSLMPQVELAIRRAAQRSELEELTQALSDNQTFLERLNAEVQLEAVFHLLLENAVDAIANAESGSALLLNKQTNQFEFVAAVGWDLKQLQAYTLPYEKASGSKNERKPKIIANALAQDRIDYWKQGRESGFQELELPKSSILLPIEIKGELLGYFNIDNRELANAFTQDDLQSAIAKIPQMQLAVQRSIHQKQSELLAQDLHQNQMLLERLNQETDLHSLMHLLLEQALQLLPNADSGSARLLNERTDCYEFVAAIGWDLEKLKKVKLHVSEDFFHQKYAPTPIILDEEILEFDKLNLNKVNLKLFTEIGRPCSTIALPIVVQGKVIGNFNLNSKQDAKAFSEKDLERLSSFVPKCELTIRRLKSSKELTELAHRLTRQQKFLEALNAENSPKAIYQLLLNQALRMLPSADCGTALMLNDQNGKLEYVASIGWDISELSDIQIDPQDTILSRKYNNQAAIITEDLSEFHSTHWHKELASRMTEVGEPKSFLCLPVSYQNQVVGYFNINNMHTKNAFSHQDLEEANELIPMLELSLKRAKEIDEQIRHQQRLRLAYELGQELIHKDTIEEVAETAVSWASEKYGYELVAIALFEDPYLKIVGIHSDSKIDIKVGHTRLLNTNSLVAKSIRERRMICISDTENSDFYNEIDSKTKSNLATPIFADDKIIGVLNIESYKRDAFDRWGKDLAAFLANQLAGAFSNIWRGERLKESEKRFRHLVESVDAIVWRANPDTFEFTYVSPEAEAILGYPTSDWIGDPDFWPSRIHPDDRKWAVQFCKNATEAGENHQFEYRMQANDGRVVWLRAMVSVVLQGNKPTELVGVMVDITDQKQALADLHESEAKFSNIFYNASTGIALVNTEGFFIDANPQLLEMLGYTLEELKQMNPMEITHPDDRDVTQRNLRLLVKKQVQKIQLEKRYIHKDGRVIWGFTAISAFYDERGEVLYLIPLVRDISERKKAEQALRHRMAFESLVSEIASQFLELPSEDIEVGINEALSKLGNFMGVDRAYIAQLSDENLLSRTNEWCAPGIESHMEGLQEMPTRSIDWIKGFQETGHMQIEDVAKLPEDNHAVRMLLEAQEVKSLLVIPLISGVNLAGCLGLHSVRRQRIWDENDIKLLNVLADVISNALERNKSSLALKHSEERYRDLVENITDVLFTLNTQGEITFISPVVESVTGYLPEEVIGKQFADFVFPNDVPEMKEEIRQTLKGKIRPKEFRVVTKIGRPRWVRTTSRPFERNGKVMGLRGVLSDIQHHKQAAAREKELQQQLETTAIQTATMLARTIDEKDAYTAGHCQRLADYASVLGRRLGLSDERLYNLHYAALLHDVGKLGVPEHILNKPSELDSGEWERMKQHVQIGVDLVSGIHPLNGAATIIAQHHEQWDGKGYPYGLKGEQISLEARILSVVDAFDAMTTDRPYRKALSREEVLESLERHAGSQWDPKVVNTFLAYFDDIVASPPSSDKLSDLFGDFSSQ